MSYHTFLNIGNLEKEPKPGVCFFAAFLVTREKVGIEFASLHPLEQRQKSSIPFTRAGQDEERLLVSKEGFVHVGVWPTHDANTKLSSIKKGRIYENNVAAAISPFYFMIIVSNQYKLDLSCWVLSRWLSRRMLRELKIELRLGYGFKAE